MNLAKIWTLKNKEDLIMELYDYVGDKCEDGEDMSVLSHAERVFYVCQALEMEVNSGGFQTFFENFWGCFSNEIVSAFQEIGASRVASLCQDALDVIGFDIPEDEDERGDLLESMEDRIEEPLGALDDKFYEYEENLADLNYRYVMANKEQFS